MNTLFPNLLELSCGRLHREKYMTLIRMKICRIEFAQTRTVDTVVTEELLQQPRKTSERLMCTTIESDIKALIRVCHICITSSNGFKIPYPLRK